MNKGEFIKSIACKAGFTQKDAQVAYDAFVESVTDAFKAGEKIQLAGFGTFELKTKAARVGINPKTKEEVKIAACKNPVLKFGKSYKAIFND